MRKPRITNYNDLFFRVAQNYMEGEITHWERQIDFYKDQALNVLPDHQYLAREAHNKAWKEMQRRGYMFTVDFGWIDKKDFGKILTAREFSIYPNIDDDGFEKTL